MFRREHGGPARPMEGALRNPMGRRKQDPSIVKISLAILIVGGAVYGVMRFSEWFNKEYIVAGIEASAEADLLKARQLAEEGNAAEARLLLRPILARVDDEIITPKALILQADLEREAGNVEAAIESLRRASEDYAGSPGQPAAAIAYARLLEDTGDPDKAVEVYGRVKDTALPELAAPALSGLAREKQRANDLAGARDLYAKAVHDAPWGSRAWEEAAEALGALNVHFLFSSSRTPQSKTYKVARGDSLTSIGNRLNTTQGLLTRANGIANPNLLRPGQILKYTPKDFRVVIERSTCRLFLLDGDGLFKVYQVGLGSEGHETTLGKYKIGNKEKDPTWFKPGSEPIPSGDPRNELGTRWMPLVPEAEDLPTDLGIHGTIAPETIGQYASKGCPRLLNEDIEELYDLIVRATPAAIVETFSPDAVL